MVVGTRWGECTAWWWVYMQWHVFGEGLWWRLAFDVGYRVEIYMSGSIGWG